jgi:hypothetical protein
MSILEVLESLGEAALGLPESEAREAVVRVRFVRRRGAVVADLRLSDGRRTWRRAARGVNSHDALRKAVG